MSALPPGWSQATDATSGQAYFVRPDGSTSWEAPSVGGGGDGGGPAPPAPAAYFSPVYVAPRASRLPLPVCCTRGAAGGGGGAPLAPAVAAWRASVHAAAAIATAAVLLSIALASGSDGAGYNATWSDSSTLTLVGPPGAALLATTVAINSDLIGGQIVACAFWKRRGFLRAFPRARALPPPPLPPSYCAARQHGRVGGWHLRNDGGGVFKPTALLGLMVGDLCLAGLRVGFAARRNARLHGR